MRVALGKIVAKQVISNGGGFTGFGHPLVRLAMQASSIPSLSCFEYQKNQTAALSVRVSYIKDTAAQPMSWYLT